MLQTGEGDAEYDEGHYQPPTMHINLSTASQDCGGSLQAQLRINSQPKDGEPMDPVLHKVCILNYNLSSLAAMRRKMPSQHTPSALCTGIQNILGVSSLSRFIPTVETH